MKNTMPQRIKLFTLMALATISLHLAAYSPADTVIAFDIHDVLMQSRIDKMMGKFLKNPSLILKVGQLSDGSYGDNPKLRKIINSQKPICETWNLIKKLKTAGYSLYIFSNIDKTAFDELKAKFPAYFSLFDDYHVVHNNDAKQKKPAPSAYDSCRTMIEKSHPGKRIIFVDDKKENIQAACKAGFRGIHFTSAEKLTVKLKVLL